MEKTILVTGGAGYIGSHTCKLLHSMGYIPVVLDNLVYGHRSFVQWGPLVEGDINDPLVLERIFLQYSPRAVIHFAAFAYVGESMTEPAKYYQNNVSGTLSLLEAMRKNSCNHMVFSSSCATYGLPESLPINEQHPQSPISPYGRSKLMVEEILQDYDRAYGVKSVALRYFNAAGADPEGQIGEDHTPETHLIPLTIYSALGRNKSIEVFGTDYPTSDGTAIRDYIHVDDLADAHVRSLEFLDAGQKSDSFNLGTGSGSSVQQVIDAVGLEAGCPVPVVYSARRPGDPPVLVADACKAQEILGWRADHSDLAGIISSAWKWHEKQ